MGNIGDTISDTAPAVGSAGPGYATIINSLLTELRARLVAKIPLSSLLTNSNLDLNGQALLNAAYITLVNESVSPVASPSNRIAAYGGDFWWVSPSGAVKITNGNALNAAGIGGITGDYDGNPEEFRYDLANTRYDAFANQASNTWAYIRARGFDIAGGATSNFRLRHTYSGGSNQALEWPVPAASSILVTSATGNAIEFSPTINANDNLIYTTRYKTVSAYDLYYRGHFNGTGTGAISVTDEVPKYRLDTAGGEVRIPLYFDTEGATAPTSDVPVLIKDIRWFGQTNGGGFPTISIVKIEHSTNPLDTSALQYSNPGTTLFSSTLGDTDTCVWDLDTPMELAGDEYAVVIIHAETNNTDTNHITITHSKEV